MILVLITAILLFMIYQTLFHVNSEEPVFFPFSIKTSKCSGSCNNIIDPYAKLCLPDVVKNLNVRGFI